MDNGKKQSVPTVESKPTKLDMNLTPNKQNMQHTAPKKLTGAMDIAIKPGKI